MPVSKALDEVPVTWNITALLEPFAVVTVTLRSPIEAPPAIMKSAVI